MCDRIPLPDSTRFDRSGLRAKYKGKSDAVLDEVENEANQAVSEKYLVAKPSVRRAPFDLGWAYKLHKEMFGKIYTWAGTKRTESKNIGVAVHQIDPQLETLLGNLHCWRECQSYPSDEQAVRLHHAAVQIHPFNDGNGRWSRMLANVWLKQNAQTIVHWPTVTTGKVSKIRSEYVAALKAADKNDFAPLLALHKRYASAP